VNVLPYLHVKIQVGMGGRRKALQMKWGNFSNSLSFTPWGRRITRRSSEEGVQYLIFSGGKAYPEKKRGRSHHRAQRQSVGALTGFFLGKASKSLSIENCISIARMKKKEVY